jgi:glycosyltransferase involved in cell wall biosynthesis
MTARPRVTFLLEQHVGLKTYAANLRHFVEQDDRIDATWVPVTYYGVDNLAAKLPGLPDTVRGTLMGRQQVRHGLRQAPADAYLFMTQTPVVLGGRRLRKPYVVMTDDTPRLYDQMADHYGVAGASSGPLGWAKHRIMSDRLQGAFRVLPMSRWAETSLVGDYGVDPARVHVVPSGVDIDVWRPNGAPPRTGPLRTLFVGGDFDRKGGPLLLEAFRQLREGTVELHLVTRSDVPESPGIHVYRNYSPNQPELIQLFQSCHAFVLASQAEAFPNVVMEASAAGLPCIVTDVGAMSEMVIDGVSGYTVEVGDAEGVRRALRGLADDRSLRDEMAAAARRQAEQWYDGRRNARIVVDELLAAAATF